MVLLLSALQLASAASTASGANAQLASFLSVYISNSVAANAVVITNGIIGSNTYVLVQVNSSVTVLVNTTIAGAYSFPISNDTIYKAIRPYIISRYYPSANATANLTAGLNAYITSTRRGTLFNCLNSTGVQDAVNSGYVCSPGAASVNDCMFATCRIVPECGDLQVQYSLLSQAGIPSLATAGIQNLSIEYNGLTAAYARYFNSANSLSVQDISPNLLTMGAALVNISLISSQISVNPVMGTPPGTSFSGCPATGGPWPCDSIGYCDVNTTLKFNTSMISELQSQISAIEALPLNFSSINALALSYNKSAEILISPVKYKAELANFTAKLSLTFNAYAALSANMSILASHYSNSVLDSSLKNLTAAYNTIILNGPSQNATTANGVLSSSVSNALKLYGSTSALFYKVYNTSVNNTALITINELDYNGDVPAGTLALASRQALINEMLQSSVNYSQLAELLPETIQISSQAKALSQPFSLAALVKWIYGGLTTGILSFGTQTAAQKDSAAPTYAALADLVVALLVVGMIYEATYARLKKKGKIRMSPAVERMWTFIFILLIILAAADAYSVYAYAQKANGFLPISGFLGSLSSSNGAFIGLSSSNESLALCASTLQTALKNMGKTSNVLMISNLTCTYKTGSSNNSSNSIVNGNSIAGTGNVITGSACYNKITAAAPVIILSSGNGSTVYKGMYGDVVYVNGTPAYGASCPFSAIVRKA